MKDIGREGLRLRPRGSSVPRRRADSGDRKSEEGRMNRTHVGLIAGVMVLLLGSSVAFSQTAGPAGMKLYAFSSGGITLAKSALQSGAPSTPITVPVGFFVVTHPQGNVLFDTGNNDTIITDPSYWGPLIKLIVPRARTGRGHRYAAEEDRPVAERH